MRGLGWMLIVIAGLLSACAANGGAVVFAPTPLPPDLSPRGYTHPSGAFSVDLPPDWAVRVRQTSTTAEAAFSPPGATYPALSVAVVNLGSNTTPPLVDIINTYQADLRPDARRYSEQDRQAMGDGSWRLLGLRVTAGGQAEQVNTFIGRSGNFLGVVEALLPSSPEALRRLEQILNTVRIHPNAPLQPTDLNALRGAHRAALEVTNVTAWLTPDGVFFVTGEVANFGDYALSDVPVAVTLVNASGDIVAGARDTVMGYALPPGGFAPFSLRFGEGRPPEAEAYTVTLGGDGWQPTTAPAVAGAEALTWTDESRFSNEGDLLIDGLLTNTGDDTVYAPLATVTVFNARGDVIASAFTRITEGPLEPGASLPYRLRLAELGGQPTQYIVTLQAYRAAPTGAAEATAEPVR